MRQLLNMVARYAFHVRGNQVRVGEPDIKIMTVPMHASFDHFHEHDNTSCTLVGVRC